MKSLTCKRTLSLLLTLCLTLSLLPVSAPAAEDGAAEALCVHTAHDAACGYMEAAPCLHACGEDCDEGCIHIDHDEACGYLEAAACTHVCGESCGAAAKPAANAAPNAAFIGMMAAAAAGTPDTLWYTNGEPFIITTADQLAGLAQLVNDTAGLGGAVDFSGKTITLGNNISLTDYQSGDGWTPIGTSINPFKGTFNGGNNSIIDLAINTEPISLAYVGLFGYVGGGTVKNLTVTCDITVGGDKTVNVGGIAGRSDGDLENCNVAGSITYSGENIGCYIGGITGSGSTISSCTNTAAVSEGRCVGGIAGGLDASGTIDGCINTGSVGSSTILSSVGGITGDAPSILKISNCLNTGNVTDGNTCGGIAGYASQGSIINCGNTGSVSASGNSSYNAYAGGLVGSLSSSMLQNCYATGDVTGSGSGAKVGGAIGNRSGSTVQYGYWNTDATQTAVGAPQTPGKGVGSGTDNTTGMTSDAMQSLAFVNTLNANRAELNDSTLLYWALDSGSANGGYPVLTSVEPPPPTLSNGTSVRTIDGVTVEFDANMDDWGIYFTIRARGAVAPTFNAANPSADWIDWSTPSGGTYTSTIGNTTPVTNAELSYFESQLASVLGHFDITAALDVYIVAVDSFNAGSATDILHIPVLPTPSVSGTLKIGGTLTASVATGTATYQWYDGTSPIGANAAYTVAAADVTKPLTVKATGTGNFAGASAEYTTAAVPYTIKLVKSGNTGTDDVFFGTSGTMETYATSGALIFNYVLDNSGSKANGIAYSGVASKPIDITSASSGMSSYTVSGTDATNGVITITATFSHTNLTPIVIVETPQTLTYTGSAQGFAVTTTTPSAGTINSSTFTVTYNQGGGDIDAINAGTYNVVITRAADANYAAYSKTITGGLVIGPKNLSSASVSATFPTVTYTGSPLTPLPTSVTFDGAVTTGYTLSNYQDNTDAGTASVDITGTGNYSGMKTVTFTIGKATYTGSKAASAAVLAGQATTGATLALPALPTGLSYPASGTAIGGYTTTHSISDGILIFSTNDSMSDGNSEIITIPVTGGTNYDNFLVIVTVTATDKTPVTISGVSVASKTYDGAVAAYSGTPVADGGIVVPSGYDYEWKVAGGASLGTAAPKDAGSYVLIVSVLGNDPTCAGSQTIGFTISKATITITADNQSIIVGSPAPTPYTCTVSGLVPGEALDAAPTAACTVDTDAAGIYPIIPSGATAPDSGKNYNAIVYQNGTLTVSALPIEATPTAAIDYTNERLTGLVANAAYSINGGANVNANSSGHIAIAASWPGTTITIVKKGTAAVSTDSGAQSLSIPARAPTPTTPTGGAGQITGVASTMEYKLSSASTWTAVSGTTITGLAAGTYQVRVKATGGGLPSVSVSITVTAAGNSGGSSSGGGTSTTPSKPAPAPNDSSSSVLVDGKETSAGTVTTNGDTTTVAVNQDTLNKEIETAKDNVTVIVPDTGKAEAQFVVKNMDDMAEKDMTLTVQVGNVQYELPAAAVDTAMIMAALGIDDTSIVPINVTITTELSEATQAAVENAVQSGGAVLVFPPVEFKLTATYDGKTVEISTFSQFVSRTMEITAEQAGQITTALVIEPDGTTRHVPTSVYQEGGKWYATINSLTNSVYALVYNEVTFADAKGKWYESAADELASRMVLSGVGNDLFAGERDMTRAEFAAVLIHALGLPADGATDVFDDVSASAWYSAAVGKAYAYGIASGEDGKFDPERSITRQEAMLMIQRAAQIAGFDGSTGDLRAFSDADSVSDWALGAARWNVGSGLVVGSNGLIRPQDNITRAEVAMLVLKLLQKAGLVDVRTPLAAQAAKKEAFAAVEPRKEPEPMQTPESDDEETPDPDGDKTPESNASIAQASYMKTLDGLVKLGARGEITVREALATLNTL